MTATSLSPASTARTCTRQSTAGPVRLCGLWAAEIFSRPLDAFGMPPGGRSPPGGAKLAPLMSTGLTIAAPSLCHLLPAVLVLAL